MLAFLNRLLSFLDLEVRRTVPASLRYSKPNYPLIALSTFVYVVFGWCSLLLLSISNELGERAGQCALSIAASPWTAWFFIAALAVFALYLLRPELDGIARIAKQKWKRTIWRWVMCLSYIYSGFFLVVGATLFGVSSHLLFLEQSLPTIVLFIYGLMTLLVGLAYRTQAPEILWRIRRARKHPLTDVFVPIISVLFLVLLVISALFTPLHRMLLLKPEKSCPQVELNWQ